jgi:hypothetical protein
MGILRRAYGLTLAVYFLPALLACQTTTGDSVKTGADGELAFGDPSSALEGLTEAKVETPAIATVEPDLGSGVHYNLGSLTDQELQDVAYQALRQALGGTKALGDGESEASELGEPSSFTFNIVKLLQGKDDISGEGGQADGMDVEVTGWYKRSLRQNTDSQDPTCTSFDALVAIIKQGDAWHPTPGETPTFGREDREDCF